MTKAEIYMFFHLAISEVTDDDEDVTVEVDHDEVLTLFSHLLSHPKLVVAH